MDGIDVPEYLREPYFDESTKTITVTEKNFPISDFAIAVDDLYADAERLLLNKHANYGPTNISRSPGGPLNGLRVRMWDKIARLNHMIDNGVEDAVGEALEETLMDLANYALIGVLVLRGEWPDE